MKNYVIRRVLQLIPVLLGISILIFAVMKMIPGDVISGILGIEAMVTEDIHNLRGQGAVSIGGLTWSARSEHDAPIPAGTLVRILRIEGVKVYVEELKEDES